MKDNEILDGTPSASSVQDGYGTPRLTLRKSAKLRHRSLVGRLFEEGKSIYDYPLRLTWRVMDEAALKANFRDAVPALIGPVQILVTVPKKKRRHAVDRVLIRRRIREAFRLHSRHLRRRVEEDDTMRTLSLAFIYLHNDNVDYSEIERRMIQLLRKVERRLWPEAPAHCESSGASVNAEKAATTEDII